MGLAYLSKKLSLGGVLGVMALIFTFRVLTVFHEP